LVVRFRHLHPAASSSRANVGIKMTTSNYLILVEHLNLTFDTTRAASGIKCQIRSTSLSQRREQEMSEPGSIHSAAARFGVLQAARDWLERDGRVGLATVIDTWGSAPVPVGGQLAIATDGSFEGSVSGGCIEGEVITEAEEVLNDGRPRT